MKHRQPHPMVLGIVLICLLPRSEAGAQAPGRLTPPSALARPPLPQASSPIDFFRALITATPQEREKLLAAKEPKLRKALEDYALKYQALPSGVRELRLRNMELRYHVTSLLQTAPSNRMERLKSVPERDRPLVEDRLKIWSRLSTEQKELVLKNEPLYRELIGVGVPRSLGNTTSLTGQASNQVVRIEQQFVHWQMLPDARHAQIQKTLRELFELTDAEKASERLEPFSLNGEERQLMENTLARFKQLSPSQRNTCVTNFSKLASLSPAERREFLVNAEEWQKMKPEDREAWRKLIGKVPPMPPMPRINRLPPMPTVHSKSVVPVTAQNTNN